jgi:hypothetical protein
MSERIRATKSKRAKMRAFYFNHSPESLALAQELAAKENLDFSSFNRMLWNKGLEAMYSITMHANKPIIPKDRVA